MFSLARALGSARHSRDSLAIDSHPLQQLGGDALSTVPSGHSRRHPVPNRSSACTRRLGYPQGQGRALRPRGDRRACRLERRHRFRGWHRGLLAQQEGHASPLAGETSATLSQVHTSDRHYRIRRPLAASAAGAAVTLLGGLIGLGGAEFRLPLLIAVFALYPHRAIRINLLINLTTLARLSFIHETYVASYSLETGAMLVGGIAAAWIGAGLLSRIPKDSVVAVIAALLALITVLLVIETLLAGSAALALPSNQVFRVVAGRIAGVAVGAISSLLGVAGGEFIIPILIFVFGADIKTAGTASVLISMPIVVAGVARHVLTGHFRSRSMLGFLVLPMSLGSIIGAVIGGYLSARVPSDAVRKMDFERKKENCA